MLTTWQKIAPLFILIISVDEEIIKYVFYFIIISSLVGGLGGLNQTYIRPLLAYSRIGHIA